MCQKLFLHNCVGLSVSAAKIIKSTKSVDWSCTSCSNLGDSLIEIKSLITTLQQEIASLKAQIANNKTISDTPASFSMEEVISEIENRNLRKSNLVIFGIQEDNSLTTEQRKEYDETFVTKVFKHLLPESDFAINHNFRLGKFDSTKNTSRPTKVIFSNSTIPHLAIKNAFKLKDHTEYKNLSISFDKTPKQQEQYKKLKEVLEARIKSGETNLKIKYIHGTPQIVQLN